MNATGTEGVQPTPSFNFLHKIYSIKKRLDLFDILQAIHPTHSERLYLAGFLKYAGYSYDEAFKIIDEHAQWEDYDPKITAYQLSSVFKQSHRSAQHQEAHSKRRVRKWQLSPAEEYRCKYYRSMEAHRELEKWMQENGVPTYDAEPSLPFDAAKMGPLQK